MTICAWCEDVIAQPMLAAASTGTSHGICRSCLSEELAKLRPTVSPMPLFASPAPQLG
jgi:hypothetical protein